jgi:hypothetical protein
VERRDQRAARLDKVIVKREAGMHLKKCCEDYVLNAAPKLNAKKPGRHPEEHRCPKCGVLLNIEFECVGTLGTDQLQCTAVGLV